MTKKIAAQRNIGTKKHIGMKKKIGGRRKITMDNNFSPGEGDQKPFIAF